MFEFGNQITNATQAAEYYKKLEAENKKTAQRDYYQQVTAENITKTAELTRQNAQSSAEIAKYTIENQKSTNKQFWSSIIIAFVALVISIISLHSSHISSTKSEKFYELQLKKQQEIIDLLNVKK